MWLRLAIGAGAGNPNDLARSLSHRVLGQHLQVRFPYGEFGINLRPHRA